MSWSLIDPSTIDLGLDCRAVTFENPTAATADARGLRRSVSPPQNVSYLPISPGRARCDTSG